MNGFGCFVGLHRCEKVNQTESFNIVTITNKGITMPNRQSSIRYTTWRCGCGKEKETTHYTTV